MTTYSFYYLDDGRFTGLIADIPATSLQRHLRAGVGAVAGRYDCRRARVEVATGRVVDYVEPRPSDTEWATHRLVGGAWIAQPTTAAKWRDVRSERDRRLAATDWRVAAAAERGEPVPEQWRRYRQALRDITEQLDPDTIAWPAAPL